MDLNNILQSLDNVEEVSACKSNLKKIQGQMKKLSHYSLKEGEEEILMTCILKYIDCVISIASNKSFKDQIKICRKSFNIITEIVSEAVQSTFVKVVTKRVFDIIIEDDVQSWCIKKELLKAFISCIQNSDKTLRQKTVQDLPDIYLFKLVDSISTYGDYDLQLTLIETVFRMYGKSTITAKLKDLIPESQELSETFAEINGETFDEDVRKFLNALNTMSGKVFSVVCQSVYLGNVRCEEPMDGIDGLWVDFNLSENAISWYCNKGSFNDKNPDTDSNDNDDRVWNLITLFTSDIESVQIHRPIKSEDVLIYFKLKDSCISSFDDNQRVVSMADDLKLVVSYSSNKITNLLSKVLPYLFKSKYYHNSTKVSSSKKPVYKPLNVSISKKIKSEFSSKSRSDTSSFVTFFDPISGKWSRSDISSDDAGFKKAISISSASTKCDVISIPDSSNASTELSWEILPLKKGNNKVERQKIENTQYETAQTCLETYAEQKIKVSRSINSTAPKTKPGIKCSVSIKPDTQKTDNIHLSNINETTEVFVDQKLTKASQNVFTGHTRNASQKNTKICSDICVEKHLKVSRSINLPVKITESTTKYTENTNDNTDYETAEAPSNQVVKASSVPTEDTQNSIKVSSPKSKPSFLHTSFEEQLRSAQEDMNYIQILSGRCSGSTIRYSQLSKSSGMTSSTPRRLSEIETGKGGMNKNQQSSSTDNFETAKMNQNTMDLPGGTQDLSEGFDSLKVNIFKDKGTVESCSQESKDIQLSGETVIQNVTSEYFPPPIALESGAKDEKNEDNFIVISEDYVKLSQDLFVTSDEQRHNKIEDCGKNVCETDKESVVEAKVVKIAPKLPESEARVTVKADTTKIVIESDDTASESIKIFKSTRSRTLKCIEDGEKADVIYEKSSKKIKANKTLCTKGATTVTEKIQVVEDACQITEAGGNNKDVQPSVLDKSVSQDIVEELIIPTKVNKSIFVRNVKKKPRRAKKGAKTVDKTEEIEENSASDINKENNNVNITSELPTSTTSLDKAKRMKKPRKNISKKAQMSKSMEEGSGENLKEVGDQITELEEKDLSEHVMESCQKLPPEISQKSPTKLASGENNNEANHVQDGEVTKFAGTYRRRRRIICESDDSDKENLEASPQEKNEAVKKATRLYVKLCKVDVGEKNEDNVEDMHLKTVDANNLEAIVSDNKCITEPAIEESETQFVKVRAREPLKEICTENAVTSVSDNDRSSGHFQISQKLIQDRFHVEKTNIKVTGTEKIKDLRDNQSDSKDDRDSMLKNYVNQTLNEKEKSGHDVSKINSHISDRVEPRKGVNDTSPKRIQDRSHLDKTNIKVTETERIKGLKDNQSDLKDDRDIVLKNYVNQTLNEKEESGHDVSKINSHIGDRVEPRKGVNDANKTVETKFDEFINKSCYNQTLSTTLGTRKRKLYNPEDLSYWQDTIVDDSACVNDSSHAVPINEPSTSAKVVNETKKTESLKKPRKSEKPKRKPSKKTKRSSRKTPDFNLSRPIKVVNPNVMLKIPGYEDKKKYSHLRPVFHSMLESFRQEIGKSFSELLEKNTPKEETISKKNKKKNVKRYMKRTMKHKVGDRTVRAKARSISGSSTDLSLNLGKKRKKSDHTPYLSPTLPQEASTLHHISENNKKINIISNIQIRPKRMLLDGNTENSKKYKYDQEMHTPFSQETVKLNNNVNHTKHNVGACRENVPLDRHLPIISESITREEINSWIATGSPKYQTFSECRYVFKHAYCMFKSLLDSSEVGQERQDIKEICRILKKYV